MRYLFVIIAAMVFSSALNAQVHVNINLGSQPVWGPVGYDYVENYYLPDIDVYYNVPQHSYYYIQGGRWIRRVSLPPSYSGYNIYNSYKVVINDREPWRNHGIYRDRYSSYRGKHDQQIIRDSRDSRYFVIKKHPEHNNWIKQQKHDNGLHKGWNKGNNGNGKGHGNGDDKGNGNGKHK